MKGALDKDGFAIIEKVFSATEVETIIHCIEKSDKSKPTFLRSDDLFAIRQFVKEIPEITSLIFNQKLKTIIQDAFGRDFFLVKSIYFDKPPQSNWFVAYHQDITISVDQKTELSGYSSWTQKQGQYAVQPPLDILENIFTIRLHLDDTDENNGALRVMPASHLHGVFDKENPHGAREKETICTVPQGGIMLMKPLLLHASSRSTNEKRRRVIHLEFCDQPLPEPLYWAEFCSIY